MVTHFEGAENEKSGKKCILNATLDYDYMCEDIKVGSLKLGTRSAWEVHFKVCKKALWYQYVNDQYVKSPSSCIYECSL